jgi:hypothetical protein
MKPWYDIIKFGGEGTWGVINIYADDEEAGWIAKFVDEGMARKFVDYLNGKRNEI